MSPGGDRPLIHRGSLRALTLAARGLLLARAPVGAIRLRSTALLALCLAAPLLAIAAGASAQEDVEGLGLDVFRAARSAVGPEQLPTSLSIVFLITILSLAPAILIMTTSFTRIIVVFGFLRQAMATQQSPPNQILVGLALILTFFIMMPTYQRVNDEAIQPYLSVEITEPMNALDAALGPIREFMFKQVNPKDLALFIQIAKLPRPETPDDVPTHVLMPGFILSELRYAFYIGFTIYIPFLIIDMMVASTLMSMGMMMLPPIFVSLPFKIIMFVLADGWYHLVGSLVESFQ